MMFESFSMTPQLVYMAGMVLTVLLFLLINPILIFFLDRADKRKQAREVSSSNHSPQTHSTSTLANMTGKNDHDNRLHYG